MNIDERLSEESTMPLPIGLSFFTQSFILLSILRKVILNLVAAELL